MKKIKNKKVIWTAVILLTLILVAVANPFSKDGLDKTVGDIKTSSENTEWQTYTNEALNFSIDLPSNWHVYEELNTGSPVVNIYKKQPGITPPFDHFSRNPHVSIYPNGIPKEGIVGASEPVVKEGDKKITNFVLDNKQIWATMINFSEHPDTWKDWGFVWARNSVSDYEEKCFSGSTEVTVYECNIFDGDEIRRFGEVDEVTREIELKMIESFKFIK